MQELLGHIKTILYIAIPIGGFIAGYIRLGGRVDANSKAIKDIEKEYIKELNAVDDKLERVFGTLKARAENLKSEYLTKEKYNDMEEAKGYKVEKHVSEEIQGLKDEIGQTMTGFVEKFGKMFEDMQKTIRENGKI